MKNSETTQRIFPPPPQTDAERIARLRLLRSRRVGPATFYRLLNEHDGSADAALAALPDIAAKAGVFGYTSYPEARARQEVERGQKLGAVLIAPGEEKYPAQLLDLNDPPPCLWVKGRLDLLAQPIISLVGARNASSLGLRMARRLAQDLGNAGYAIASGLARGIDAAAHHASLDHGTIAVLGGGIDVIYPEENRDLFHDIAQSGLLITEQPVGLAPRAQHFPRRNRIIAGLAEVVVLVEAAIKSGSMITARDALEIGREVMVVPGHPMDPRSGGGNSLIREGARLIRGASDIIEDLPHRPASVYSAPAPPCPPAAADDLYRVILDRLGHSPTSEDLVIRDAGASPGAAGRALSELELDGEIERLPGGLICRTS